MNGRPRILISNVVVICTEADIADWIETKGFSVERVVLIRDIVSGTSPSFAHVYLQDNQLLDHAVRLLNGQVLHDRRLHVCRIEPRSHHAGAQKGERRRDLTQNP